MPAAKGDENGGSPTKVVNKTRKLKKTAASASEPDLSSSRTKSPTGGGLSPTKKRTKTKPSAAAEEGETGKKANGSLRRTRSQAPLAGAAKTATANSGEAEEEAQNGKKTAMSPRKTATTRKSDSVFSDDETDYVRMGMSSRRKTYLDVLALERDRRERKKKGDTTAASSASAEDGSEAAVQFDRNGRRIRNVAGYNTYCN